MNYIQRLFDSARSTGTAPNVPVAPSMMVNSPVMAADQRLGIFPGLVDPFNSQPALDPAPQHTAPERAGPPAPSRRQAAPDLSPPPRRAEARAEPAAAHDISNMRPPQITPSAPTNIDTPPAAPINPLQRLAEMDPLPGPNIGQPAKPAPTESARPMASPLLGSPPDIPSPTLDASQPAPVQPASPLPSAELTIPNPAAITPDQFKPRLPDAVPAPATPVGGAEPALPPTPPTEVSPPQVAAIPAEPIQPSATQALSPFAQMPDLPPPPPPAQQVQSDPAPTPERIVERIREVPVAPAPPPKPMTAAAQSVIGPLSQRRFGWQPRQGGV